MSHRPVIAVVIALVLAAGGRAVQAEAPGAVLPPEPAWNGKSRSLVVPAGDPWITPAEESALLRTPRYAETVAWLRKVVQASPDLEMVSLGRSPEGRDIYMVIAARPAASSAAELQQNGKPTLLAQAGIHAGEIDGKDAGLMLLRDLTVRGTRSALLDRANLLFVPIFNVDGHERFSGHSRPNQRGPVESGWRTTARNLNLNRDYTKLDAPEMRALVRALRDWQPDLYLDLHVTDGLDYQYDITWGYNDKHAYSPAIATWLEASLDPVLRRDLAAWGHVPGPFVWPVSEEDGDITKGNRTWTAPPRFSNGYGDVCHLPTVLVENHSLKSYPRRVLGTYVLLASTLRRLGEDGAALRRAAAADRAQRTARVTLEWKTDAGPAPSMEFLGLESHPRRSPVTGGGYLEWTGKPVTWRVPDVRDRTASVAVDRPRAYWIPPAWDDVIDRLRGHGIQLETIDGRRDVEVEVDRIVGAKLDSLPFEGRVRVQAGFEPQRRVVTYPAGSVRVSTDQALGDLAVVLLDPRSQDSFFAWGFFHEVLQPTEYVEAYVMEPTAARLLESDAALRAAYEAALADSAFASQPRARLEWLYRRSPWADERWCIYPVGRE